MHTFEFNKDKCIRHQCTSCINFVNRARKIIGLNWENFQFDETLRDDIRRQGYLGFQCRINAVYKVTLQSPAFQQVWLAQSSFVAIFIVNCKSKANGYEFCCLKNRFMLQTSCISHFQVKHLLTTIYTYTQENSDLPSWLWLQSVSRYSVGATQPSDILHYHQLQELAIKALITERESI